MADILGFPHGSRPGDYLPSDVEPPCEGRDLEQLERVATSLPISQDTWEVPLSPASKFLARASYLVDGDRARQHGDSGVCLQTIADAWSWWLGYTVTAYDVAQMMSLLKKAREKVGQKSDENTVDDLGYTALAGQHKNR